MVYILLKAGANPKIKNKRGGTPLASIRNPLPYSTTIAILEQAPEAEKTSLLVKARRLVTGSRNAAAPSYLQKRVRRGLSLPSMGLAPVTDDEEDRTFRTLLTFLFGMGGGPEGAGMPRDVFRVLLNLPMPLWDPLRRRPGAGPSLPH